MRTNQERGRIIYKLPDLVVYIKRRRFEWLGHATEIDRTNKGSQGFESKLGRGGGGEQIEVTGRYR
jgi:hypothetical protein